MFEAIDGMFAGVPPARYVSLCVAEIDGTGARALLLAAVAGQNQVLALTGDGPMRCDPDHLGQGAAATLAICAADVDGDGAEELFVGNGETAHGAAGAAAHLFDLDAGEWHDLAAGLAEDGPARAPPEGACAVPAVGRATGLLVAAPGTSLRLWALAPDGRLRDLASGYGLDGFSPAGPVWYGRWPECSDALIFGTAGGPWRFVRDPSGRFVEEPPPVASAAAAATALRPVAALREGRVDLLQTSIGARQRLLASVGGGTVVDVAPRLLGEPGPVVDALAADLDGDGEEELLLLCDREPNRLFGWREGGWRPLDAGAATLASGRHGRAAFLDVDLDGRPELVLLPGPHEDGRPVAFRAVPSRPGRWVGVAVRALTGGPARGATVRARVGGRLRVRTLDCGDGRVQTEPVARFGLGDAAAAERVEILWPDGTRRLVHDLAGGGVHRIPHPAADLRPASARSREPGVFPDPDAAGR